MTYCIMDRDYHTHQQVQQRHREARERHVQLHVWKRKEIENYLLVPTAIQRVLSKAVDGGPAPEATEIDAKIDAIAESLKDEVLDALAVDHLATDRRQGITAANRAARARLAEAWRTRKGRLSIVPGKALLSRLSEWAQNRCGASLSPQRIARDLLPAEVDPELRMVITCIDQCVHLRR